MTFADQNPQTVGAYHTADVPYWLDTFDAFNLFRVTRDWTADDRKLSETMLQALIALANTGSPGTQQVKWVAWSARHEHHMQLGDGIRGAKLRSARMECLAAHPPATTEHRASSK